MRQSNGSQMTRTMVVLLFIIICFVVHSNLSLAANVGAPITKAEMNSSVRAELIYEKYDRKVEFSKIDFRAVGPSGTTAFTVGD